ncbi:Ribosomal RNA small subunit methyltransferase B [Tepidimonas alkaliphilus]|uniref:Ribosomal RNA small subunit methyltransferase B n=1 Tax=Tepidimonas alkaliphilus TaxID=2588942 RepID=A0A554W924_9BURK|nr:16S rRNA (cytosine(967)-C(5))-methyltransferase RsmB [Tepidimonas alkaliphilus]TSE20071.1 Ribosomal RNA small subunit methyltransferase B [Tepidimonas alkaliphilus]
MAGAAPPLRELLAAAAHCVAQVHAGRSLSVVLPGVAANLRPGVQALVFETLRRAGTARALVRLLASRLPPPPVAALLEVALTLLLEGKAYAAPTVVDQAVQALGRLRASALRGFVNACLRRYLRESEVLRAAARATPEGRWNHPAWWVQRLQADHPRHWAEVLQADDMPAPLVLRVNRRRTTRAQVQARLAQQGCNAEPIGADGLVLAQPMPVDRLPGWNEGWVSVQDGAAQLAAPLLLGAGLRPGARVLDACAAPGGKSAHLLEQADVELWALDADAQRLQRLHETLERLRLPAPGSTVQVRCADAADPADWWDGRPFDAIVLDAPCTASGIVRRHPDVRWLRRPDDVERLAAHQRRLLQALWPLLAPGGRLLMVTCSVFRAEGEETVAAWARHQADARVLPAPGHLLPWGRLADPNPAAETMLAAHAISENARRGMDGFFYALLAKAG